jgi:hypothetical protein
MKNRSGRWIWWVVIAVVAAQLYLVQELAAALLLFAVVFLAFASLVGIVRLLQFGSERAYAWGEATMQRSFTRKPFRRLRSETAR